MKKSGFCLLLAGLVALGGCGTARGDAPEAGTPPAAAQAAPAWEIQTPVPAQEPEVTPGALNYPAPAMENSPYADLPEGNYYWAYDIYALYGGQEPCEFEGDLSLRFSAGEGNYRLSLPQMEGDDALSRGINAYYQAEYERRVPELEASQTEAERDYYGAEYEGLSSDIPFFSEGEHCRYTWGGYCTVVFYDSYRGGRSTCNYYTHVFEEETGGRIGLGDLFSGAEEEYVPALQCALAEHGYFMPEAYPAEYMKSRAWLWYDGSVPLPSTGSFLVTPNGLAFPYDTGAISAMASGCVTLLLPYEAVAGLLRPEVLERVTG
ncbi:hypothetical protein CE91St41_15950 [Oscillospiraceae bacterium]|nr:hypothetical protein CE91St40_21590 [Oscillospiraceae bacterium]BDF74706.1 hypothetical protein CE91St41_15950 [Oscillospiraceae bacterium]